ncbi:Glutamine amidotransferase, class I [Nocardioides sp. PD653]|nr:Glutamine amidotransferase, class I [Nocardioides sp. PD653-B2]GAW53762.1 Glutamine amidotransferase, class I [Nocardioides sp. PD653]
MSRCEETEVALAWPLRTELDVSEVLRAFRSRDRLVALLGSWADGGAIIAFDPVKRSENIAALAAPSRNGTGSDSHQLAGPDARRPKVGAAWIGVLSYQLGALFERLPDPPPRSHPRPPVDLAYYDRLIRFDAGTGDWWFEARCRQADLDAIGRAYERTQEVLAMPAARPLPFQTGTFRAFPPWEDHAHAVATALEHIAAGDIFQVNTCLRLDADFAGDPLDAFIAGVDALAPAYAAFVRGDRGTVASLSPELFLRRSGRHVSAAPIKGTAALSTNPEELLASAKNRAENLMIVDLMRNDLARISVPGSVSVPAALTVQQHTGVWHLVSEIEATLDPHVTDSDLVRATFPPGSVTGAPKVKAMEIINDIEITGREAYTGAIGWSGAAGLELNVAIRTFEFAPGSVWLGVGGGIVSASDPQGEVNECMVKAAPLVAAIGGGLDTDAPADAPSARPRRATEPSSVDDLGSEQSRLATHYRSSRDARNTSVLLIDNYDSFAYNLVHYCQVAGAVVTVVRNDSMAVDDLLAAIHEGRFDRVVISPGPGRPESAGVSVELVRRLPDRVPLLGVCLGHQAIAVAYGARVARAPSPVHGRQVEIHHDQTGIFRGLPTPLIGGRYHSLTVDDASLRGCPLNVSARSPSGLVMGIRHQTRPVEGLQFHPESILTSHGQDLVNGFLDIPRTEPIGVGRTTAVG